MKSPRFTLFIPVYNVAHKIEEVITRIPESSTSRLEKIFFFDNGSTDSTIEVILSTIKKIGDPRFHVFKNKENYFLGGSTILALKKSIELNADFMICLHGDGQADPKDIEKFISIADSNPQLDFIFGSRLDRASQTQNYSPLRLFGNHFFSILQNYISGLNAKDIGAYIAFNLKTIQRYPYWQIPNDMAYQPLLVLYISSLQKINFVEFPIYWGEADTSSVNIFAYGLKHLFRLLKMKVIGFPLQNTELSHFSTTEVCDAK